MPVWSTSCTGRRPTTARRWPGVGGAAGRYSCYCGSRTHSLPRVPVRRHRQTEAGRGSGSFRRSESARPRQVASSARRAERLASRRPASIRRHVRRSRKPSRKQPARQRAPVCSEPDGDASGADACRLSGLPFGEWGSGGRLRRRSAEAANCGDGAGIAGNSVRVIRHGALTRAARFVALREHSRLDASTSRSGREAISDRALSASAAEPYHRPRPPCTSRSSWPQLTVVVEDATELFRGGLHTSRRGRGTGR